MKCSEKPRPFGRWRRQFEPNPQGSEGEGSNRVSQLVSFGTKSEPARIKASRVPKHCPQNSRDDLGTLSHSLSGACPKSPCPESSPRFLRLQLSWPDCRHLGP